MNASDLIVLLLATALGVASAADPTPQAPMHPQFIPDQPWLDDHGVHINAHGGGVLFHEGTYYWFGEHKIAGETVADIAVHCYSSSDLYHWKDEGAALSAASDPASDLAPGCIVERPKVIYNAATRTFVMWFHLELKDRLRKTGRSGLAVATNPAGPYTYVRSVRPDAGRWPINVTEAQKAGLDAGRALIGTAFYGSPHPDRARQPLMARDFDGGQMAKDMTLFVDDDGTAYHVFSSEENSALHISQLSADYQSHTGKWVRLFPNRWHEAPALVKHAGRYWMLSSHCTGWCPNAARLSVADSIWGPWTELGNPCTGDTPEGRLGPDISFGGQSTHILPVAGRPGAYIAMFDVWRPENQVTSSYVWLPMTFADGRWTITWRDRWDLGVFGPAAR